MYFSRDMDQTSKSRQITTGILTGLSVAAITLFGHYAAGYIKGENRAHVFPRDINVSEGYVKPSQLEIELRDLDGDGTNETLVKYIDKSYLLRLDERGEPIIQSFEVEKAKIVPGGN